MYFIYFANQLVMVHAAEIYGLRMQINKTKLTPWPESASGLHQLSDRCLLAMLVPTFADRGFHVISVTDP
jgi:hypothetical protein